MNEKACQAIHHDSLLAELLDSRVPKTEREHAAARGLKDAERYRKLSVLIESGEWFAGFAEIVDSYGATKQTMMDDKADLDKWLDSDEVTQSAKSWEIALANVT